MKIKIEVSKRHVHLSKKDLERLFGEEYKLKVKRQLSQPGQFAAEEKVILVSGDKKIEGVRVLGPESKLTQVELAKSDARFLGLNPPRKVSGDLKNTPGIEIIGPTGKVRLNSGVIMAQRHLHLSKEESSRLGIKENDFLEIKTRDGKIIDNILVRVDNDFYPSVHIDNDEAQEFGIEREDYCEILGSYTKDY